eukprot:scaffold344_cov178-Ochromonas_danica.AAC.3
MRPGTLETVNDGLFYHIDNRWQLAVPYHYGSMESSPLLIPQAHPLLQTEEVTEDTEVLVPLSLPHSVPVSPSSLRHYRRYLTRDELVFAWNAVIIFILTIMAIMIFVSILLLSNFGADLFCSS